MPKTFAVEDERYARGISTPAAVDEGAYRECVEEDGIWERIKH